MGTVEGGIGMKGQYQSIRQMLALSLLILSFLSVTVGCAPKVQLQEVKPQVPLEITNVSILRNSFNPTSGEVVEISYQLSKAAVATVRVFDPDCGLIKTLVAGEPQQKGINKHTWDGKDIDGKIVPDQAYFFTIEMQDASGKIAIYDPTTFSGGVEYDITDVWFDEEAKTVSFTLPEASWVLCRLGIKESALLKTLLDWEPRPMGENIVFWDGMDESGVADLLHHPNFVYLMLTNALPENSVIAVGNNSISYRAYKEPLKRLRERKPERPEVPREGVKLSRHHKLPHFKDHAPNFSIFLPNVREWTEDGIPILKGKTLVQVILEEHDVAFLTQMRYEIAFYVDYELYAEEEEAYSPFNWVWDPRALSDGEHILTVNVVSLWDQIGARSLKFVVSK